MSLFRTLPPAPSIVDPFSKMGDEIAGETASEVAVNLSKSVRLSRNMRLKQHRNAPDLRKAFKGSVLSEAAKDALRFVEPIFLRLPRL